MVEIIFISFRLQLCINIYIYLIFCCFVYFQNFQELLTQQKNLQTRRTKIASLTNLITAENHATRVSNCVIYSDSKESVHTGCCTSLETTNLKEGYLGL